MSRSHKRKSVRSLNLLKLEDRLTPSFSEFLDPHPAAGNQFGQSVVALSTGNIVITSPYDDAGGVDSGAVYLFNGSTGALISSLIGSHPGDHIGDNNFSTGGNGVIALSNGNFVVSSPDWGNGLATRVGAVTWGSGTNGISGVVGPANSLVGSTTNDGDGLVQVYGRPDLTPGGVTALTNGNYVVRNSKWDNGLIVDAGAATWGSGTSGISGAVSFANSLVGSTSGDQIGRGGVTALTNGNYVVVSYFWDNGALPDVGAVTWGSGTTGISGAVNSSNSLIGKTGDGNGDRIGSGGVTSLTNGNYVVSSPFWINGSLPNVGAVTWGNGTTGITGEVSTSNSLFGTADDGLDSGSIGSGGITALSNGNFVVSSPNWQKFDQNFNRQAFGAVTWGNGTTGTTGAVTSANSLVGKTNGDHVGDGDVTALTNGNYVVRSPHWKNEATLTSVGAVTWGNGSTGISGFVNVSNSLIGNDFSPVGEDVTPLSNGNYVVSSPGWRDSDGTRVGAVTWENGATGIAGFVTAANSLIGTTRDDGIGNGGVTALSNGNYVVSSPYWDSSNEVVDVGAVTWGNGTIGISGKVSATNSLVGVSQDDNVSSLNIEFFGLYFGVTALANGNYVVSSPRFDSNQGSDVGASTWCNGTTGSTGQVNSSNSLIGSKFNDHVSSGMIPFARAPIDIGNVTALNNGNYLVLSPNWSSSANNFAGAVSWANGATGSSGAISDTNSLIGLDSNTNLQTVVVDPVNGNYFGRFIDEDNKSGRVRVGSVNGFTSTVPSVNLSVSANAGTEAATTSITVTATASDAVIGDQTVTLSVTGTGIAAADYSLSNSTITILNGQTTGSVTFTIINDTIIESVETANLTISNPSAGLALGVTTTQTISILSDEVGTFIAYHEFSVGSNSSVNFYNPDGTIRTTLAPFGSFTGGIRTASGDFTGDGIADLVVGTGPGSATQVKIIDGVTQTELFTFDPFEAAFTGGIYVTVGDIDGDGIADLAITPDEGGGPRCRIISGNNFTQLADFFGIDDPNFRGGARASIGDVNGDGSGDLVVVAGFGGGPRVAAFDGKQLSSNGGPKLFGDFFAFEQALRNGIFIAAGDVNGDGFADLVAGGGPGGGPRVYIIDGKTLVQNGSEILNPVGNFFAGDTANRGGIRVAVKDLDGDNQADVVTGAGTNAGSRVSAYLGKNITPLGGTPPTIFDFDAFAGLDSGIFVG